MRSFRLYFVLISFIFFLIGPTLVTLIEKECDVSTFFSLNEEEENNNNRSDRGVEEKFKVKSQFDFTQFLFFELSKNKIFNGDSSCKYNQVYLDLIFPPPEFQV